MVRPLQSVSVRETDNKTIQLTILFIHFYQI